MGFLNWLLRNGPGSPGSTASSFVKLYEQTGTTDHEKDWETAFLEIFHMRYIASKSMGFPGGSRLNQVSPQQIVHDSGGDLPTFIYAMMIHETSSFRENISPQTYFEVTQVIYDMVKKKKPTAIRYDLDLFQRLSCTIE